MKAYSSKFSKLKKKTTCFIIILNLQLQVSNQVNQNIGGIQDVASNLEQAFKPVTGSNDSVSSPTQESRSHPGQANSGSSSRRSSTYTENRSNNEKSKER